VGKDAFGAAHRGEPAAHGWAGAYLFGGYAAPRSAAQERRSLKIPNGHVPVSRRLTGTCCARGTLMSSPQRGHTIFGLLAGARLELSQHLMHPRGPRVFTSQLS
jgi:hypothetical protein